MSTRKKKSYFLTKIFASLTKLWFTCYHTPNITFLFIKRFFRYDSIWIIGYIKALNKKKKCVDLKIKPTIKKKLVALKKKKLNQTELIIFKKIKVKKKKNCTHAHYLIYQK